MRSHQFRHLLVLSVFLISIPFSSCQRNENAQKNKTLADSVVRVTATIQYPDLHRPWLKKTPFTRAGLGTVIKGGRLLVTADTVAHSTYIELEKPEDGPKCSAVIESLDDECNLAVLKPTDADFLKGSVPLKFSTKVIAGSKLELLQLEQNGAPAMSPATVTTVAVMPYPADGTALLTYRTATVIPQREDSFVIPALQDGKLAGLVMRYDSKTQAADIIPFPIIERFLKESANPGYKGLARAGLLWEEVRGSTLRKWLGAGKEHSGVYVTWVEPDGPAEKAGLRKGDLLLKVSGQAIDGEGNYLDPIYGRITFNNLASLKSAPGDHMQITYFRSTGEGKGVTADTTLQLEGSKLSSEISPSRLTEDSVAFTFLGGLLFQELSRPYLREWGSDWRREAPQNLVFLDAFQHELPSNQGHIVILSSIFPSSQTVGFQDLGKRAVQTINNREIHRLSDVNEAIKTPLNGFHKIILEGSVGPIYLDASTCESEEQQIRQHYGIPSSSQESR